MGTVRSIKDPKNLLTLTVKSLQEMVDEGKVSALVCLVATTDEQHTMAIRLTPETNLHAIIGGVALLQRQLEQAAFEMAAQETKGKA